MCKWSQELQENVPEGKYVNWERHLALVPFLLPPPWSWESMPDALADFLSQQVTLGVEAKHQEGGRKTSRHGFLRTYGTTTSRIPLTKYSSVLVKSLSFRLGFLLVFVSLVWFVLFLWNVSAEPHLNPSKRYTSPYLINSQVWLSESTALYQHGSDHYWEKALEKWAGFLITYWSDSSL